jgi:glutamyl-tRNA reductase
MQVKSLNLSGFFVAGINYKKTDADLRGRFAIQQEQYASLLVQAKNMGLSDLFVLSTCNRAEIYGFADSASQLVDLLCSQTAAGREDFLRSAYIHHGDAAIQHLFYVGAGLDSQILGDYEIVGQIKAAVKFSKTMGCLNTVLERMVNTVLQCSKAIKNQTALSDGTVSVSFAAVQYIREHVENFSEKNILLVGIGKIGRNTCKNLVDYLDTKNITLVNRTEQKAAELAAELSLQFASFEMLAEKIEASDIILVATDAAEPTILASHLAGTGKKLLLDLSIPFNVETSAREIPGITLVDVDELSNMKDMTLAKREAEVPMAKEIVREHMLEFTEWSEMRRHVPVLKAVKLKLEELNNNPLFIPLYPNATPNPKDKIQRVINGMASKMKARNQQGCHYIEAINEFMATGTN